MSDLKAKSVEGDFICDLGISILGFAICNLICVIEILSRAELLLLGSRCVALLYSLSLFKTILSAQDICVYCMRPYLAFAHLIF